MKKVIKNLGLWVKIVLCLVGVGLMFVAIPQTYGLIITVTVVAGSVLAVFSAIFAIADVWEGGQDSRK